MSTIGVAGIDRVAEIAAGERPDVVLLTRRCREARNPPSAVG